MSSILVINSKYPLRVVAIVLAQAIKKITKTTHNIQPLFFTW